MENLDKRYQTLLVLWAALLMNIGVLFVVALVAAPPIVERPPFGSAINFASAAVGTFLVVVSFAVKNRLLQRSVERQDLSLVQKALVIACAMCEACALFGLVGAFVVGGRDHYVLFFLAAAGIAFHFPRRIHLQAASYKAGSNF